MPRAATLGQQWGGLALVLLVATLAALAVLRVSRNEPTADLQWVDLRAGWRVSDGDDLRRSLPGFDDSAWSTIDFPVGWSGPEVESDWWWFRREVRVTPNWDGRSLDFEIGGVHSAYELFVNGQRIGGAGRLGPDGVADFDRIRRFVTECDCHDGRLLLALRVWRDANVAPTIGGLTQGPFQMALAADVMRSTQPLGTTDLLYFGLATLFAGTGLLYLELYRRWPAQCGYLWIGLLAFGYGAYLLLRSQLRFRLGIEPDWLKELEHGTVMVLPAIYVNLQRTLLQADSGAVGTWLRNGWLLLAGLAVLPGLKLNYLLLPIWQYSVVLGLSWCAWQLMLAARSGSRHARTVFAAILVGGGFIIHDILAAALLWERRPLAWIGLVLVLGGCAAALAEHLQDLYQRLDSWGQDLDRKVALKTERLRRASEAKSHFLATVSHEIRTPLAAVLGYNSLLLETHLDPTQHEYASAANRSGEAVLSLLEGVLDLSQIEAGKISLQRSELRLSLVCEEALEMVAGAAGAKGLDLGYDVAPDVDALRGDPARIRQILVNLLSNAVKFTSSGSVWIEATRRRGLLPRVEITVTDSGAGIDPALAEKLLEPFVQGEQTTDPSRPRGSGLGLAISRGLAVAMGGDLTIAPGAHGGTVATLSIPFVEGSPFASIPPLRQRVRLLGLGPRTLESLSRWLERWGATIERTDGGDPEATDTVIFSPQLEVEARAGFGAHAGRSTAPRFVRVGLPTQGSDAESDVASLLWPVRQSDLLAALVAAPTVPTPAEGKRDQFPELTALVVDDDDSNRLVVGAMLANAGVSVSHAADGTTALEVLARERFHLVLLDLRLPGASGYEVATQFRRLEAPERTPTFLVALSADTLADERTRCRAAGFDDYVPKPIRTSTLIDLLERTRLRVSGAPK